MAASINDRITDTFNSANPNVARVTGTRAALGATLSCDNLAGWPTGSAVHFSTYQINTSNAVVAGTQIDWKGIVSGNNIGSLTRQAGATDSGNAIGDVVEMNPTGSWGHDLFTGFTAQHSQLDGSHGAITSTALTNTGTLTNTGAFTQTGATTLNGSWDGWVGANESWAFASSTTITVPTDATTKYDIGDYIKITQSATVKYFRIVSLTATVLTVAPINGTDTVANSAITANAYSKAQSPHGISPAWVAWTPTWVNLTIGNGTNDGKYIQQGKVIHFRLLTTLGTTSSVGTRPTFTLPVTSVATPNADFPIGEAFFSNGSNSGHGGHVDWASTTTGEIKTWDGNMDNGSVTASVPFVFASGNKIQVKGFYEAA